MHKYKIVIWESQSNISGGQQVALNIAGCLHHKYDLSFIIPAPGRLSDELNNMGIDVNYIPIGSYQRERKSAADIIKFLWFTPPVLLKLYRIAKDADLIYANSTKLFIWSAIVGSMANTPVIWHLHNLLIDNKSRMLVEFFGKWRSVKKIIAVSHATKKHYERLGDKIEVIYNGIDTAQFTAAPHGTDMPGKTKKIGIIADLLPIKGHDTLIKAIPRIKKKVPVHLMIVGASADNNVEYEMKIKRLVRELDLGQDVEFMGYRSDVPDILKSLDLVVVPSSSFEACPMAVLEAYACGVPVIGSDMGGIPELIEEGKTGYIFKARDVDDLAEKILLIFENPQLYVKMRINSRKIAEERFDLRESAKKIESIILQNI